jgi:hypothetical protein
MLRAVQRELRSRWARSPALLLKSLSKFARAGVSRLVVRTAAGEHLYIAGEESPWLREIARSLMSKDRPDTKVTRTDTGQPVASRSEIDAFLARVREMAPAVSAGQRGRLVFALDATMSRQPTWDSACQLQAQMFEEAARIGGLDVQLVYFRGLGECRASDWVALPERLGALMEKIDCRGGHTQMSRVLRHVRKESEKQKVAAHARRRAGTRRASAGSGGLCRGRHESADRSLGTAQRRGAKAVAADELIRAS